MIDGTRRPTRTARPSRAQTEALAAVRHWVAERLQWEQFLDGATRDANVAEHPKAKAA